MVMLDNDYQLIATAPRDGTVIEVMDPDCGSFPMRWNPEGDNAYLSTKPGIWETADGSMTWCEDHGCGPSYWRTLRSQTSYASAVLH